MVSLVLKKTSYRNKVSIYVFKYSGKECHRQKVTKKVIHKSLPRTVETKPDTCYMIHNLLYETKITVATKKARVKIRSFYGLL